MSDGVLSRSCAEVTLSLDEVDEDEDRFPPVPLVSGRGHKMVEVRTRLTRELRALMGEDQDGADGNERTERGLTLRHDLRGKARSVPERHG